MIASLHRQRRILIPERPGYGLSEPTVGYTFTTWADDRTEFVDALGIARFQLVGFSAGSAYALAAAAALGERVTHLTLLCSPAPISALPDAADVPEVALLRHRACEDVTALTEEWTNARLDPEALLEQFVTVLSGEDRSVLNDPYVRDRLHVDAHETLRQGPAALAWDIHLTSRPWRIPFAEVCAPTRIHHGLHDRNCPLAGAHYLAKQLDPAQRTVVWKSMGHLLPFAKGAAGALSVATA